MNICKHPRPQLWKTGAAVLLAVVFSSNGSMSQNSGAKPQSRPGQEALVARGKYIVEGLAVCGQCHTPRDDAGILDRSKELAGAPVWLRPAAPSEDWPVRAPRIAGTPPASDEEMVRLLTTGIWRDGRYLRPPMPQFRMDREDAQAVTAYLRSLTPGRAENVRPSEMRHD